MYPGMARTAREEGFDENVDWFETLQKQRNLMLAVSKRHLIQWINFTLCLFEPLDHEIWRLTP